MQDNNTTESTLFQLLGLILSQNLWHKISQNLGSVDRYVKKLKTAQLIQLVIKAEMQEYTSPDEISNGLTNEVFAKAIHLDYIIPFTQSLLKTFNQVTSTYLQDTKKAADSPWLPTTCRFARPLNALTLYLVEVYLFRE